MNWWIREARTTPGSFTVEARMDGTVLGVGTGNTKKAAEQEAAYHALIYLRREDAGKIL